MALRGSVLFGKTSDKRKRVFEELKTAYRERGNIAHGGPVKGTIKIGNETVPFHEFVTKVEQHLRLSIQEFLERSKIDRELQVISDLDERIIAGSELPQD